MAPTTRRQTTTAAPVPTRRQAAAAHAADHFDNDELGVVTVAAPAPAPPAQNQLIPAAARRTRQRTTTAAAARNDDDDDDDDDESVDSDEAEGEAIATGRKRRGRPPKAAADKSQGWIPSDEDMSEDNPDSPGHFKLFLHAQQMNEKFATDLHTLLRRSAHPFSILHFLRDRQLSLDIIRSKTKSPYTTLIDLKAIMASITPSTAGGAGKWAPLDPLSIPDREFWSAQYVLESDNAITYGKERAAEELPITLDGARALLRTTMSGAANPFFKYSKRFTLLSLYLNFWPLRDNFTGMVLVRTREDCTDPKTNYLIVPNINADAGWKVFIQQCKTAGEGLNGKRKYEPILRELPTHVLPANQIEQPFVEAGETLRGYIRLNNRNSVNHPPAAFAYGSKPFDNTLLSKYLTKAATDLHIIESGSFLNLNRKLWDNYYYEHDRSGMWPKVVQYSFHTAAASRESYMRGDTKLGCACQTNPQRPEALAAARAAQQAAAIAAVAAAHH